MPWACTVGLALIFCTACVTWLLLGSGVEVMLGVVAVPFVASVEGVDGLVCVFEAGDAVAAVPGCTPLPRGLISMMLFLPDGRKPGLNFRPGCSCYR